MKKILLLAGLIGLIACETKAQTPVYYFQTLGSWTNALSTATNVNVVINVQKQQNVAIMLKAVCDTTNLAVVQCMMTPSVDGINYDTTRTLKIGGTTVANLNTYVITTNVVTAGIAYWKVNWITNDSVANSTNLTMGYGIKISSP